VSALDDLELRAAFEARRALGTRVLLEWACLRLPLAPRSRTRAECARGALIAALAASDEGSIDLLLPVLAEGPRVDPRPLLSACEAADDAGLARRLVRIAADLEPTAETALVLAGLVERCGETEQAASSYRHAIELAERVADAPRALRGRIELARCLSLAGRDAEALDVLAELDELAPAREPGAWTADLDARDRLVVARVWLAASGRYRRASRRELLVPLVAEREDATVRAALRPACTHVDRLGTAITEPEADRVFALASAARARGHAITALDALVERVSLVRDEAAAREAATARAAMTSATGRLLVDRARAVRDGGSPGPRPEGEALPSWLALATLAHVRARRLGEAQSCLRELDLMGTPPDAAGWTAISRATRERALHVAISPLLTRWLDDDSVSSPPRGFLDLGARLDRAGLADHAGRAIDRARQRQEPDARGISIRHAIRRAWSAYDRGDRREARALLLTAMHDARAGTGSRNP